MSDILRDMPIDEVRRIAEKETPKPETGTWMLMSPTGKMFLGDHPLACIREETTARIPPDIALARIRLSMEEDTAAIAQQRGSGGAE